MIKFLKSNLKYNINKVLFITITTFIILFLIYPSIIFKNNIINNFLKSLGFELNNILIEGNKRVIDSEILNKIKFKDCTNLFCIDLKESKKELEKNDWIKLAKLKYNLPSKLIIVIEEEKPIYILRNNNQTSLLNDKGKKIEEVKVIPSKFENLIILSGQDVENKILNLLNILSVNIEISEEIKEATLVSKRRWSLKHSSNITIELPELNPDKAFYKIAELEKKYGFLNSKIKKIDLRPANRIIIQLKNESEFKNESNI